MGRLLSNQFFHWVYITNTPKAMSKTAVTEEALERFMDHARQLLMETGRNSRGARPGGLEDEELEPEADAGRHDEVLQPAADARSGHGAIKLLGNGVM